MNTLMYTHLFRLQRAVLVNLATAACILLAWGMYSEQLMLLLGQQPDIVKDAKPLLLALSPALLTWSVQVPIHGYFTTQGVVSDVYIHTSDDSYDRTLCGSVSIKMTSSCTVELSESSSILGLTLASKGLDVTETNHRTAYECHHMIADRTADHRGRNRNSCHRLREPCLHQCVSQIDSDRL